MKFLIILSFLLAAISAFAEEAAPSADQPGSGAPNEPAPMPAPTPVPTPGPAPEQPAPGIPSLEIQEKIISQGVPRASLMRILDWMQGKHGTTSNQRVYQCKNKPASYVRPCPQDARTFYFKDVSIKPHRYAVSVNFTLPSTVKRFYLIDLQTGAVEAQYATHGKGSGRGAIAERFSNVLDSNTTSLGIYLLGEVYRGDHEETIRMYGLERTNDQAYDRDIVLHSAEYADEKFFQRIDPNTGKKYTRLGLSNGCPAINEKAMKAYLNLLKEGGLIDHHHDAFTP